MIHSRHRASCLAFLAGIVSLASVSPVHARFHLTIARSTESDALDWNVGGVGRAGALRIILGANEFANASYGGLALEFRLGGTLAATPGLIATIQSRMNADEMPTLGSSQAAPVDGAAGERAYSWQLLSGRQGNFSVGLGARALSPATDFGLIDCACIDLQRLTTTNPEPATLVSALVGLPLLDMLRRRRLKKLPTT